VIKSVLAISLFLFSILAYGQDLLSLVEDDSDTKEFVTNGFKSTRIINTHSCEHLHAGVLDVRILHRFGPFHFKSGPNNQYGINNLYGLDQANMRLAFDYGITDRLMIGVGRSNVNRELDGFLKYRLLWQAKGKGAAPLSILITTGITLNTMPQDTSRVNFFSSRMAYYAQVVFARKFSEIFTLQITPGMVHYNLVEKKSDPNDIYTVGLGGRLKISKRVAINWDYQFVLPGQLPTGYGDGFGIGFDIETGGHVFQLHLSNSVGMNERAFLTRTPTTDYSDMGLRLGFNLSRVFTVRKR
jgi:Membrane bound beta barrel domain (DUF5777)